jgi:hypothetical protein
VNDNRCEEKRRFVTLSGRIAAEERYGVERNRNDIQDRDKNDEQINHNPDFHCSVEELLKYKEKPPQTEASADATAVENLNYCAGMKDANTALIYQQ